MLNHRCYLPMEVVTIVHKGDSCRITILPITRDRKGSYHIGFLGPARGWRLDADGSQWVRLSHGFASMRFRVIERAVEDDDRLLLQLAGGPDWSYRFLNGHCPVPPSGLAAR